MGDSCISLDENSLNQTGPKKTKRRLEEPDNSSMDVDADEDYDFVPGTPPHKKVLCVNVFTYYKKDWLLSLDFTVENLSAELLNNFV